MSTTPTTPEPEDPGREPGGEVVPFPRQPAGPAAPDTSDTSFEVPLDNEPAQAGTGGRRGGDWAASRFPDRHFFKLFMLPSDCSGIGPAPLAGSGIQVLSGDGSDYSGSRCTVQCPPGPSAVSGT